MLSRIQQLIFLTCLIFASSAVFAKDIQVTVKLMQIDAKKTSEKSGDELYFSITEYSNKSTPKIDRVPMFPTHWLSKDLSNVKDVTLWDGKLQDDESVLLILSLIEQDLAPWDADDHIGSVQVRLTNENGKLKSRWGQPKFRDQPRVVQEHANVPRFQLFGSNSQYAVLFRIETPKD